MENKINVAELLKDCPKGMELDCTMFENVTFVRVDMSRKQFPIEIAVSGLRSKYLTKEGCFHDTTLLPESKCVIFPKGKTTWEGFVPPCKFKVGDKIKLKGGDEFGIITEIADCFYTIKNKNHTHCWPIKKIDDWELVPDKFDITTLKPFESRVLVRTKHFHDEWIAGFFSHKDSDGFAPFWTTADKNYQQCIPYEGNEHLLGTSDDCDEIFKTWK